MEQLANNPVRTNHAPTNQRLEKWSVVGYDFKHVGLGNDIRSQPKMGIIWFVGVDTLELKPVEWKRTTDKGEIFQASVMVLTVKAQRDQIVKYSPGLARRQIYGWEVIIPKEYWKRDSNVLVMELIRRKYATARKEFSSEPKTYPPVPQALRLFDDQMLDIYTDGSLTERDGIIHMGAAAIVHRHSRILGHYACSIPPVDTNRTKKNPGTTKPEIIGAALGAWVAYKKYFRSCNLFIDNLAVVTALREKKFERLLKFDPHAGALLKELDKRNVLNKITWIKGHQKSSTVQSLANDRADEIAEAARRQARIVGSYESLPLVPHHELQIVPIKDGGEYEIPEYRSTTIDIPRPIVPDATAILQGWTNKDILESQQAHMYQLVFKGSTPISDSPEEITITAMSLRIKSGLLPISAQKLVDRPDIFGIDPPCPACHQNGCFSSSMAGWKHLLFECQMPSIRQIITKYVHEADQRTLEEAMARSRQKKWDKSSLTEIESSNDYLEQHRSCRKCVIPRMVLNTKAGDTNSSSSERTRYRLDLYHWYKANKEVYQIWRGLLDEYGLSLDITILDAILGILVEKETNICIRELEPTHLGPSIWLKPKSKENVDNEFGIRAIKWSPVLAVTSPLCWWNFDVITGNVCKHRDSLPQGVVVYVKNPNATPLERLRTLWNSCYVQTVTGINRGSSDVSIWINGSDVSTYIKDVPGINSATRYANTWVPPPNELRYNPTHWWLGRKEEDLILWYQGRLHRGDIMQRNLLQFSRLAQRIEGHFRKRYKIWCDDNAIESQVLWDRVHYREFQQRPQNVKPYIKLTPNQKQAYKNVLAQNRRAIAANQRKTISVTDSLPEE
jgi:ribonuclease HI